VHGVATGWDGGHRDVQQPPQRMAPRLRGAAGTTAGATSPAHGAQSGVAAGTTAGARPAWAGSTNACPPWFMFVF
jgi:hypothetical protein